MDHLRGDYPVPRLVIIGIEEAKNCHSPTHLALESEWWVPPTHSVVEFETFAPNIGAAGIGHVVGIDPDRVDARSDTIASALDFWPIGHNFGAFDVLCGPGPTSVLWMAHFALVRASGEIGANFGDMDGTYS